MSVDVSAELLLREAERDKFYGSLEFKFECGKLILVRKTETIKPQSYRDTRDGEDERR